MYIDVDVPGGDEEDGAPHLGYVVTAPQRGNPVSALVPLSTKTKTKWGGSPKRT